ncbi:hypothetical protein QVD17_31026 [Tagetes erecta]|uniref:LTI65/LTI78 PGEED repeat domain-containing protein n=1 Tax=Tagetes erecta TaxID=13708 RepID=A0AAD8K2L3_TARER|nr:hypothetical protein QVD17_31026 [Tagetes erecta]
MKKVKEKLKATIHSGHHKDEAQAVNDSHVVRSGLAEPTVMGTPVLAEDLYATHSDIVDTPVRSFSQWEDEEKHHAPPPLSTGYETHLPHSYGQDLNRDQFKGTSGDFRMYPPPQVGLGHDFNPTTGYETQVTDLPGVGHFNTYGQEHVNRDQFKGGVEEGYGEPPSLSTGYGAHSTDRSHDTYHVDETAHEGLPHDTGGQEVGITGVLKSFDKMKLFDEHDTSDQHEPNVYTGSHDQFAPEHVEKPPLDTIASNPSNPNSSYTQRISAIAERVAALKDTVVSKLSSSGDNTSDASRLSPKTNKKASFPTELSHKVADTLSGTLGPVYEKVAGAGSSVMSRMQSSGGDDTGGKGVTVKEYLADTFKPGDDDKVLSEVITHALHRGKGNQQQAQETSTTTYVIRDEGERRLQDN